jgi:hypothetical protein
MAGRFNFEPVPTVAPSGPSQGDYQTIQASPGAFGAYTAQGLETLGQGAEHAGEAALTYEQARQGLVNETHASELNTWLANQITDKYSNFSKLEGRAAQDALPAFKADIDTLYQDHLGQAGDNMQLKAQLAKNGSYLTDAYYRYATNHADQQFTRWQDTTATQRAATFGGQAGIAQQNGDLAGMQVALNTSDDEVTKRLEAKGYDQDTIKQEVLANRGRNLRQIIEAQADSDPVKAADLYHQYEGQMDAASSLAVKNKLRGALSTMEGHRIADEETGRTVRDDAGGTVNGALAAASKATGVPLDTLRTFARIESGGNPREGKGSYRGLFALSDDEFNRYGGGNVLDARDNAMAAARKIKAESEAFATKYGREPTAGELYLIHQQGAGGFDAHMRNPDAPAWQNMASTAEGRQKGEAWAKAAIWGNIPDRDKAAFGSVDNVTSRAFTSLWTARVDRDRGGPLVDKQDAFNRIVDRTASNPQIQAAAIARMGQIYSVAHAENVNAAAQLHQREADTIAEAARTGVATNPLTPQDFVAAHGADGMQRYQQYQQNLQALGDRRALVSAPPEQMNTVLKQFEPQPGAANYATASKRYEMLRKSASDIIAERQKDPAAYGVSHLPSVQESWQALQGVVNDQRATPEQRATFARDYAEKQRLEQQRLGISDEAIRIVPQDYAKNIATRLSQAATDEDPQKRQAVIGQIAREAQMWGPYWPQVMREVGGKSLPLIRAIGADIDDKGEPMHPDAMLRLASLKPTDTPKTLLADQTAVSDADLKREVVNSLAGFRRSLMPRQQDQDFPGYEGLAAKLAALHVRDGDSAKDAAQKAANELVGDRYEFHDTWRMPKTSGVSGTDVQAGTMAVRAALVPALGPSDYYARNKPFVKPGATEFETKLAPAQEQAFRSWVGKNKVAFDPDAKGPQDYDMRGFWQALQAGDPRAKSAVDPNDSKLHYPDYWKTPYHQTFSNESQFAAPNAPHWAPDDKLVTPSGEVIFDDRDPNRGRRIPVQPFTDDMRLGADNPRDSVTKMVRDARFVTAKDNSGLNLYYFSQRRGAALPVRGADGKPLLLSWAELARRAPDAPAADYQQGP